MKRLVFVAMALVVGACAGGKTPPANNGGTNNETNNGTSGGTCTDLDGDGFDGEGPGCPNGLDCNDRNGQMNPGQVETCRDGIDNNCDGQTDEGCANTMDCIDNDGDRYGQGTGCFGPDCDDNNMAINPAAMEVCGNTIDEDCKDGDLVCPSNCIDMDMDGYGAMGSTDCVDDDGMVLAEVDCDDTNAAINVTANEVCDAKDNNCDGTVDECPLAGQACAGDTCVGGAGAQCENADDCAGTFLTCDRNQSPKVCKVAEGGQCPGGQSDCVEGLACENGMCVGNYCLNDPCAGEAPYDVCDRDGSQCVECPHFDADPDVQNAACEGGQICVPGGWCAYDDPINAETGTYNISTNEEYLWINVWMADCWIYTRPDGQKKMCSAFVVEPGAISVNKSGAETAYTDGHLDLELTMEENDALEDIWGEGLFNRQEIDWKEDLRPGTTFEVCLWYQPGGILSGETLVLDKCENFSP